MRGRKRRYDGDPQGIERDRFRPHLEVQLERLAELEGQLLPLLPLEAEPLGCNRVRSPHLEPRDEEPAVTHLDCGHVPRRRVHDDDFRAVGIRSVGGADAPLDSGGRDALGEKARAGGHDDHRRGDNRE
jgi:hypothetical protein